MRISKKLIVSFTIVIILSVLTGVVGIVGMSNLNNAASSMYEDNLIAIEAMANIRELFGSERSDIRNIFLSQDDPDKVASLIKGFDAYAVTAKENFALYESTITDASQEEDFYTAQTAYLGDFASMKKDMFALIGKGRFDDAYDLFMSGSGVIGPITNGLAASTAKNNEWASEANQRTNTLYTTLTTVLIAVIAVAAGVSLFLAIYISGLISKPVKFMKEVLMRIGTKGDLNFSASEYKQTEEFASIRDEVGESVGMLLTMVRRLVTVGETLELVANGDLTSELDLLSGNDTMGLSLQKMVENLNEKFSEINASTGQVAIGSKQIADGAQSLAQGSTEQAAAVQQLSSSISEIAEKTTVNAEMAGKAAKLADTIKGNAEKGSRQMDEMTVAVREINEASQSISKVISVIDNIAFQTNILALNAAVEAARAGQHGKGFAVVAEEVRSLAAKSAEAARNTGGLIANSMEKAELGTRIAGETAASLIDIVAGINESSQLVKEIAKSSEEQSVGISQINNGIDQVAQVVQQNSATAQESAAASQEMSGQSDMLEQLVSQFKLKDSGVKSLGYEARKHLGAPDRASHSGGSGYGKY